MFLKNIIFFLRRAFFRGKRKTKKKTYILIPLRHRCKRRKSQNTPQKLRLSYLLKIRNKNCLACFFLVFFFTLFFSKQIYFSYLHFIYFVLFFFIPYLCFLTNNRFLSLIITLRKDLTGDKLLMTRTSRYFV